METPQHGNNLTGKYLFREISGLFWEIPQNWKKLRDFWIFMRRFLIFKVEVFTFFEAFPFFRCFCFLKSFLTLFSWGVFSFFLRRFHFFFEAFPLYEKTFKLYVVETFPLFLEAFPFFENTFKTLLC